MKKLLLSTAALGLVFAASPAKADIDLDLGGSFSGYAVISDDDQVGSSPNGQAEARQFDFIRDTELHVSGETTIDNGLTVGAHFELEVDGGDDATTVEESYVYFSGGWGRLNFGDEDGAAYLLQVAAPSADNLVDGLRQEVQPFNYDALLWDSASLIDSIDTAAEQDTLIAGRGGVDYDLDLAGRNTKLTYLSPVFSGFQAGFSYTPDNGAADDLEGVGDSNDGDGTLAGSDSVYGPTYEGALRYEGQLEQVDYALGGGIAVQELEHENHTTTAYADPTSDRMAWNVGLDLNMGAFGLGFVYLVDNNGNLAETTSGAGAGTTAESLGVDDEVTWVLGADYSSGSYKFGASYMNIDNTFAIENMDTDRWTGGVTYTYGPGMTFNGSLQYVEHELDGGNIGGLGDHEVDETALLLGTNIAF